MTCDHCGKQVPEAVFCTNCGAHQGLGTLPGNPRTRHQHYAAHPGEHVAQPSVFSTLLPHVGHGKLHEFRYAFAAGLALMVIFVVTGLVVAALLTAIFLIPVLYLIYLYEAQVYRDEPALVLGATFGLGILLGVVVTVVADRILGPGLVTNGTSGTTVGYSVVVPIVQLIVMAIPPLMLRGLGFTETVDGLVFGVASGLGFSVAESVVRYSDIFGTYGVQTASTSWIYPIVGLATLIPLLHGSAAGAIVASVWRSGRVGAVRQLATLGIPLALVATVAFYLISALLAGAGAGPLVVLLFQAVPVAVLLVYIRFLLHYSLLEEARDLGFSAVVCANCHRHVMAAGFCPNCGVAIGASPRTTTVTPAATTTTPTATPTATTTEGV